jgi:hypothetical protein
VPVLDYFRQSLVPICGGRAGSLLVLDASLPPITRMQRENPGYLAIDLVANDKLRLADGRLMLVYNQAAAHRAEDLTVNVRISEVTSCPLLPHSRDI